MKNGIQHREIILSSGDVLEYKITRKNIKNLIIKMDKDSKLIVSAPKNLLIQDIERFITSKESWIAKCSQSQKEKTRIPTGEDFSLVLRAFELSLDRTMLLCSDLKIQRPSIKIKRLKSLWGKCDFSKKQITLNSALFHLDASLLDYVSLHEVIHFVHHAHDRAFWSCIEKYISNAKLLRNELKNYIL